MNKSIKRCVEKDIKSINKALNGKVKSAAIFGSQVTGSATNNSDIDLAIFVDDVSLCEFREKVSNLKLNYNAFRRNINEAYGGDAPAGSYDIVLLDYRMPNCDFVARHNKSFAFVA